jgi:tetratricopeptide (TPR) repeat protein
MGQTDSARTAFTRARKLRPDLKNLAFNLGILEMNHNRYDAALDAFRTGLTRFPDDPSLHYGMALAFSGLGLNDSASRRLAYLKKNFPMFDKMNAPDTGSRENHPRD